MVSSYVMIGVFVAICIILLAFLKNIIKQKYKTQMQKVFIALFVLMLIWIVPMIFQIILVDINHFNINIKYFLFIYYISVCFLPVGFLLMAIIFKNGSIRPKLKYLLLFIVPTISMIMLWTNDLHHCFYKQYSSGLSADFGWYFYVHSFYTYTLFAIALIILIRCSAKGNKAISKQITLIVIGAMFPLAVNFLGALHILDLNVYATPIAFALTIICFTFAILKLNFLDISPIALQTIVNIMSDGYIILDNKNYVIDFNNPFLTMFNVNPSTIKGKNFEKFLEKHDISYKEIDSTIKRAKNTKKKFSFEKSFPKLKKYFRIEVTSIYQKNNYLGTLILFKDITQHKKDIQTIEDNQNTLMERERLATLGQMIGGIAHNLKTPIMSIAGAMEGLQDLVTEYDKSIDDPEVTSTDHHAIAHDMMDWINKVNSYDAYMSDVITAVKGQAVNFNDSSVETFTIDELLKDVNILMKHELKSALIMLDVDCEVPKTTTLHGNVNSLVQVVNNLISNAIQSYNGKENEEILLTINKKNNNIVIAVRDHGSGIPDDVQKKLFNEMITTKGHKGTGLGLFMSYSTIKGHFNGDLSFESKVGEGTTFYITLPNK